MNNEQIIKEALQIYRKRDTLNPAQRDEAVRILAEHGVWSMRHILAITGAKRTDIREIVGKSDKSGGRFNPDTLDLILEEIALDALGDWNEKLTAKIWDMGTSPGFLAKLIGQPVSSVQLRAARGRESRE